MELNHFETNCLLKAVQHYVLYLRELEAEGSEDYVAIANINKYLLDSLWVEMTDNLPF